MSKKIKRERANIEEIGRSIKRIRKEFKYYQQDLVDKLNEFYLDEGIRFTQAEISFVESGRYDSKKILYIIKYFFDAHNINPEYFFIKKLSENKQKLDLNLDKLFKEYNKKIDALNNKLKEDVSKLFYK